MPNIKAFQSYYYDKKEVGNIDAVIAPPYDVINDSQREDFYQKSPFNIIRIILGRESEGDTDSSNKYTRAAEYFKQWSEKGVLKKDEAPSIYLLEQKFVYNSREYSRIGFFALFELADFGKGEIFPHEETLGGPKIDRLKLMEAAKGNFSPIFSFYIDSANIVENIFQAIKSEPPFLQAAGTDGVKNNLWKINDSGQISQVISMLKEKQVFIADGHHRYETALNYKKRHPEIEAAKFVLMYLSNTEQDGLIILPTHRAVKKAGVSNFQEFEAKVKESFEIEKAENLEAAIKLIESEKVRQKVGLFLDGKFFVLTLKSKKVLNGIFAGESKSETYKNLDVTVLDKLLIKQILGAGKEGNVAFFKEPNEAVELVKQGQYKMAFFLKPTRLFQVKEIALAGERMPKKSTYFHPKVPSGLIINKF